MNINKRLLVELFALLAVAILVTAWRYSMLRDSQRAARGAAEDLATCRQLADRIAALRERPAFAVTRDMRTAEIAKQVERAAASAQIPVAESLSRIAPEPPRRVGDGPYKEASTLIVMRQVTLRQLIAFLHKLTADGSELRAKNLRLVAPREHEANNKWTVEATVSYLIFSPSSNRTTEKTEP